jgi:anti-sigma regulatory factor (Ser/Thr protein kinase)
MFYRDREDFLAGMVPYVMSAVELGQPALVAIGPENTEALRGELGPDAAAEVDFADMRTLGRNPARIIPFWRQFLDEHGEAEEACGIGEPIWPERTAAELDECQRHERLLNVAFGRGKPWSLLCPYDTTRLPDDVLEEAVGCHPFLSEGGTAAPNLDCRKDDHRSGAFGGELAARPAGAASMRFTRDSLREVRAFVDARARAAGMSAERASDLVVSASELVANSVAHGGGSGTIAVWSESGREVVIEVLDAGVIDEPLVGRRRPDPAQHGGRGLWIANLLCDLVQIRSGPQGAAVRARLRTAQ